MIRISLAKLEPLGESKTSKLGKSFLRLSRKSENVKKYPALILLYQTCSLRRLFVFFGSVFSLRSGRVSFGSQIPSFERNLPINRGDKRVVLQQMPDFL